MSLKQYTCDIDDTALVHACDPCNRELGRVRGVMLIKPSYDIDAVVTTLKGESASSALTTLKTAIEAGNIILIPETTGTCDGGAAQTGDGYGDAEERLLGYLYTLQFNDPSYANNSEFWATAEKLTWRFAWRTETLLHVSDKAGTLQAIDPVEQDLTSAVVWSVTAKWKSQNKPAIAPIAAIEELFSGCWEVEE